MYAVRITRETAISLPLNSVCERQPYVQFNLDRNVRGDLVSASRCLSIQILSIARNQKCVLGGIVCVSTCLGHRHQ